LVRPLVSVHRLVLLFPDMYRLLDLSVHSVAFSVDDLGLIPIYDVVEKAVGECRPYQGPRVLASSGGSPPKSDH